jgi:hypothetical protein
MRLIYISMGVERCSASRETLNERVLAAVGKKAGRDTRELERVWAIDEHCH